MVKFSQAEMSDKNIKVMLRRKIMLAKTPPMGWNTWNTFASNINEELIMESADAMVKNGYKDAGYEYIVIDDCWSLRERDEYGRLVADPEKFPHGMKYVADYVHSLGLKFGMYSCAGVRTCADFPGSFDHEYIDAETFASWGVDFLKYDFCYFPSNANCKNRYLTMSMALRSCGRDILFSACNWGVQEPWSWMRGLGVHMYRSTGDIVDTFKSQTEILESQIGNFNSNGPGCFNDLDMLTVGMFGKGNVGIDECQWIKEEDKSIPTIDMYRHQFMFWCLCGSPLMMGGDIRNMNEDAQKLLTNKDLIAINQDEEARPIIRIPGDNTCVSYLKILSDGEFAIGSFNKASFEKQIKILSEEIGVPLNSGMKIEAYDCETGEHYGTFTDMIRVSVEAFGARIIRCKLVK